MPVFEIGPLVTALYMQCLILLARSAFNRKPVFEWKDRTGIKLSDNIQTKYKCVLSTPLYGLLFVTTGQTNIYIFLTFNIVNSYGW